MKKSAMVVRQSIDRLVGLLARKKIIVTQRGVRAFVKYSADGAVKSVNIPFISDDATEDFIAAVQGFLDHEVGHVLYSDMKALKIATAAGKTVASMANIIEDVFVERMMIANFPGSVGNLQSVRAFYLDKVVTPNVTKALAMGNENEAKGYLAVVAFRGWGGQFVCADYIKDNGYTGLIADLTEAVGDDLRADLLRLKSSADCLHLAQRVVKRIAEFEEEKKRKKEEERKKKAEEEGKKEEGDDIEPSVTKSSKPETDEVGEREDEDEDEGEGEAEGEDEDECEDGEGDDEDGKTGTKDSGEMGTGEKEPKDEDKERETPLAPTDKVDSDERDDAGDPGEALEEMPDDVSVLDIFDTRRDFDTDLGTALSDAAKEDFKGAAYRVFSAEWDEIEAAPMCAKASSVSAMEDRVNAMVGVMAKQLERAVASQSRSGFNPGQRRGRINPTALYRQAAGDDRLFRSRYEQKAKSTRVSLLIDCSGSMNGENIKTAGLAGYALSSTLERLKIEHEVIGFTTRRSLPMKKAMAEDSTSGAYARDESIYMPVFKSFRESLGSEAKSRLATLQESPSWLSQNVDGECLQVAAARLVAGSTAERHILMVLSDGEPCCPPGYGMNSHLVQVVEELSKQIEVIGIGIDTTSVKRFYPRHIVLRDIEHLPTVVVRELSKLLLAV